MRVSYILLKFWFFKKKLNEQRWGRKETPKQKLKQMNTIVFKMNTMTTDGEESLIQVTCEHKIWLSTSFLSQMLGKEL
jgi:hypothetical protein